MAPSEPVNVPFFKKGKTRPSTARKRSVSPSSPSASASVSAGAKSQVVLPTRKSHGNLLSAGTKRTASQRDEDEQDAHEGPDIKWTASGSHVNTALEILAGDEAEELLERQRKKEKMDRGEEDFEAPDGQYHGQKAYKAHIKKNTEIPKSMRVGPQRSTSTIKTVTIIDYQPDVCKDYKETGYCGFGDTCKFLHDRGTYLAGWQIDKLAEKAQKKVEDASSESDSDEDIPFACLICKKPYTDPIETRCGHYFCSACAIKRFARTPKCAACNAPTGGIFNRADRVIEKMERIREKAAEAAEADSQDEGENNKVDIEGLKEEKNDEDDEEDEDEDEGEET